MTIHNTQLTAARPQHRIARTKKFNLQILTMLFPLFEGIRTCGEEVVGMTASIWSCSTRLTMQMINQHNQTAEGLTQEDDIWEQCARQLYTGEELEEAIKQRRASASQPRSELIFEGLEGAGHILGKAGDITPYEYAGDAQQFRRWKIQTITYVATKIYHRTEQDMRLAYRRAMRDVIDVLYGPALQVAMEMDSVGLMKCIPRDDGVAYLEVSTGMSDLILQMEHKILGITFDRDEYDLHPETAVALYTVYPESCTRTQGEPMQEYVEKRLRHYKMLKLKDPDTYVPEVKRTLTMIQQSRIPMGINLDMSRLVRRGELRFEQAARKLVDKFPNLHHMEMEHLKMEKQMKNDNDICR